MSAQCCACSHGMRTYFFIEWRGDLPVTKTSEIFLCSLFVCPEMRAVLSQRPPGVGRSLLTKGGFPMKGRTKSTPKRISTTYWYAGKKLAVRYHGNEVLVSLTQVPHGKWYSETTSACMSIEEADKVRHDFCHGKDVVLSRTERRVAYV